MTNLTITVPNTIVPEMVLIAKRFLDLKEIDYKGLTNAQIGQKYLSEIMKDALIEYRKQETIKSQLSEYEVAIAARKLALKTSEESALLDASGISG